MQLRTRIMLLWILLVLLALLATRVPQESIVFWYIAVGCALLSCILVALTLWALLREAAARIKTRVREDRIRIRDATTESPLEIAIARELDRQDIAYEREYAISRAHVDFAFVKERLAVECDGYRYHHERTQADARRDAFLRSQGWRVLRLRGDEIREDPQACVRKIVELLRK